MFGFNPEKQAAAKAKKAEKLRAKHLEEADNPKDPNKTFRKIVGATVLFGAAMNEDVRATGADVLEAMAEGVGGRELFADLPPLPVQTDIPPVPAEPDANVAKLEN